MISRRKSKSRRKVDDCASGSARPMQHTTASDNFDLLPEEPPPIRTNRTIGAMTPKVIHTASIRRPIHLEPAPLGDYSEGWPQRVRYPKNADDNKIFGAIAAAYNLTADQCRELLHALTEARYILGYKHPIARLNGHLKG